jgi:hypothetical protein
MKYRRLLVGISLLLVLGLLAACGAEEAEPEMPPTEEVEQTPVPEPTEPVDDGEGLPPAAVLAAEEALSEALGIDQDEIEPIDFEQREWPDACLGLAVEGEMCAQVITPGFLVRLDAAGETYHVRTDLEARTVRIEELAGRPQVGPPDLERFPDAVEAARARLSADLNVPVAGVEVLSYEETEWPDACLGYAGVDELCAEVITPGYRVTARAANRLFEVHTDAGGSAVRYQEISEPATDLPGAVAAARQALAESLEIDVEEVTVLSFEPYQWPDGCLGLGRPDEMCLQVITPGYLVMLRVEDQIYEAHTNESGSAVRFAGEGGQRPLGRGILEP